MFHLVFAVWKKESVRRSPRLCNGREFLQSSASGLLDGWAGSGIGLWGLFSYLSQVVFDEI